MSRKKAREAAFKLVYQTDINKDDINEQLELYFDENTTDDKSREYIRGVVSGIDQQKNQIDTELTQYLASAWKIDRISKVDLAILRLAYYEIKFVDDVPKGVAINEAVELAKIYSEEQSAKFINGILANID
ncbi:MAG: transcription antitermination factor NusB [Clostridia bacterium]|nr:transcription antitermination factor NusB [Clostridia bacterium]